MILGSKPPEVTCFGKLFEESDQECRVCEHNTSCRAQFNQNRGLPVPVTAPRPPWAVQHTTPSAQPMVPPPVIANPGVPMPVTPPHMAVSQSHGNLYEYTPYQGETITQRLAKNIVLKSVSGFFYTFGTEMSRFFQLWRWPPNT